jgi:NAD/NADP transhydrogenase beta subunit
MDEPKPWFVKITGPMQWQIKPYGWPGWALMVVWALLLSAIMSLLLVESGRERWWIVTLLSLAITVPLIVVSIQLAVPIEDLRAAEQRRRKRARPKKAG